MDDWSLLLNRTRRMANLTQEDFACDIGVSRATLAHWENNRRPIPPRVKRYILDYMGGYYKKRIEFGNIISSADNFGSFLTLYQHGLVVQGASSFARHSWAQTKNSEMVGQYVLPMLRQSMKLAPFYDRYFNAMLLGKSDIASISYFDESFLFPGKLVWASASIVEMGEGRLLSFENIIMPAGTNFELFHQKEKIITMDGVSGD